MSTRLQRSRRAAANEHNVELTNEQALESSRVQKALEFCLQERDKLRDKVSAKDQRAILDNQALAERFLGEFESFIKMELGKSGLMLRGGLGGVGWTYQDLIAAGTEAVFECFRTMRQGKHSIVGSVRTGIRNHFANLRSSRSKTMRSVIGPSLRTIQRMASKGKTYDGPLSREARIKAPGLNPDKNGDPYSASEFDDEVSCGLVKDFLRRRREFGIADFVDDLSVCQDDLDRAIVRTAVRFHDDHRRPPKHAELAGMLSITVKELAKRLHEIECRFYSVQKINARGKVSGIPSRPASAVTQCNAGGEIHGSLSASKDIQENSQNSCQPDSLCHSMLDRAGTPRSTAI